MSVSASQAELELQKPGLTPTGAGDEVTSLKGDAWRRLRKNRLAIAGIVIVGVVVVCAVFADVIATQPTKGFFAADARQGPSMKHFFGTDQLGRDVFSRVIHGARFSLIVGFTVTAMILLVGLTVGGIAGFFGGAIDSILSRIIDVFLAFPFLVWTIIVVVALGGGKLAIIIAIASLSWVTVARLFRGSVLSIRNAEYVEAARALGATNRRVMMRHVLPNAVTPSLVYCFALIGSTIVSEAALSFLGLGVKPPEASWGLMISDGRPFLQSLPHLVIFPGVALILTVMGFILLGDGLRDSLDPRLR
jgi:ABC-type dipeptide/oligopeptide/nickel transport system permease subunit